MSSIWRAELVHAVEPAELRERPLERQLLATLEVISLAQSLGEQRIERRGELSQIPAQPVIAQQRIHHVLQLLALIGAERLHQRLHLGHSRGELLDDVVERLRAGKDTAVARQEVGGIRLVAGEAFLEQPVQLADHVPIRGQVVWRHALSASDIPANCASSTCLRQPIEQLIEAFAARRRP